MKKRILPSRSGDDGAPCAIARLVLAQARISNQPKPKHKNLPQKMAFHLPFKSNEIFLSVSSTKAIYYTVQTLGTQLFFDRRMFQKEVWEYCSKMNFGCYTWNYVCQLCYDRCYEHELALKFINFAYCQYFAFLKQFTS